MKNSKTVKWIIIAGVAAAIASITTIVILVLRARAKRKAAWYDEEPDFGYDLEDDEFIEMDEDEINAVFGDGSSAE